MFFNIVTIVAIAWLTICAGDSSVDLYHSPGKQAVSSVSYHRDDIPLSYKYNSNHPQTTPHNSDGYKTQLLNYHPSPDSLNFRSMQYAPLRPGEVRFGSGMYTKMMVHSPHNIAPNPPKEPRAELRKPIEPVIEKKPLSSLHPHPLSHLDYIPGHNIEVMRSVNRSPGHNAVYRSYTDKPPTDKKKLNYLNQYILYPNQRENRVSPKTWPSTTQKVITETTTTTATTTTTPKPLLLAHAGNPYYKPYRSENPSITLSQSKSPYTKMHALLLNVARVYNMGLGPNKGLHVGASPSILGPTLMNPQSPVQSPGLPPISLPALHRNQPLPVDQKTLLHPVKPINLRYVIHS